jgi:hypothetical protein
LADNPLPCQQLWCSSSRDDRTAEHQGNILSGLGALTLAAVPSSFCTALLHVPLFAVLAKDVGMRVKLLVDLPANALLFYWAGMQMQRSRAPSNPYFLIHLSIPIPSRTHCTAHPIGQHERLHPFSLKEDFSCCVKPAYPSSGMW